MLKARCTVRCEPTTLVPVVPEAPSPLTDSVTAPTTTESLGLYCTNDWLGRVPATSQAFLGVCVCGGVLIKRKDSHVLGPGCVVTLVKGLHSLAQNIPSIMAAKPKNVWGMHVLLSLGERSGMTNVRADVSLLATTQDAWE